MPIGHEQKWLGTWILIVIVIHKQWTLYIHIAQTLYKCDFHVHGNNIIESKSYKHFSLRHLKLCTTCMLLKQWIKLSNYGVALFFFYLLKIRETREMTLQMIDLLLNF